MSITFANAKKGCQGSGSSTSTPANTLSLFSSETKGYNFYKNKSASNDKWEIAVFGRAHNYSSSAETYDYTIYVFGRKLNSATSHGDFKVTFYYRGKSYSITSSRYLQKKTGKVRLLAYHTFDGLNCEPYDSTTIGAKVVGPSGTEAAGTITATDTADFSGGASWSVYVQSDSSIKLEGTGLTTNRGFRHAWVWQWKRTSASSYTTDATTNCGADNTSTSLSNTFSGLVRNTSYDVRARFYLRNYDPTDDTGNNPVPISSRTIVRTATTDKSDLSGNVKLTGNRYVGGTITADVTNTDNATLAYQWCYNTTDSGSGTAISGATSSTYTVTSNRVGKYIYCKVTFSKTDYNNLVIRKYTSDVVYKRTPTASVTISGNSTYGQTLTANVTCNSTGTKTYQWWFRVSPTAPATAISGATNSTYKIGSGLVGKYIGCTVSIAETDTYAATSSGGITSSAVVKASNPAQFPASQNGSVTFSTNSQNKSFTGVTNAIGNVNYSISSQGTLGGVDVDYFSIPTSTNNSITIAAGTPAGMYNLYIECNISGNIDVEGQVGNIRCILTVHKASGSGSVTMSGWTYGGTVTNPTPSSSTNGTGSVSYTWYDSNKTQLSTKPTSTSNAGTYYVKATFAATTNYNEYTTDYVSFTITKANSPFSLSDSNVSKYTGQTLNLSNYIANNQGTVTYTIKTNGTTTNSTLSGSSITLGAMSPDNDNDQTVVVTITNPGNNNYNSSSKDFTITVSKYTRAFSFDNSTSYVNQGSTLSIKATASGSGGTTGTVSYVKSNDSNSWATLSGTTLTGVKYSGGSLLTITATLARTTTVKGATITRTVEVKDATAPTPAISGGNALKVSKQTLTLSASDNSYGSGISKYYWGTSSSGTPNVSWDGSSVSVEVSASGTYYLRVADASGNIGATSIEIYKYSIYNILEKLTGTTDTYTTNHYETYSNNTYIAKKNTTLTISNIYSNPSSAYCTYKGCSNSFSTTTATLNITAPSLSTNDIKYYAWFNRDKASLPTASTIKFNYNGNSQGPAFVNPVCSHSSASHYSTSGTRTAINAGNYTATWSLNNTSYQKWEDNTNTAKSIAWSVDSATLTVTANNQSFTYDSTSHGNAIAATAVNNQAITIKYGTASGTYNLTTAPQIKNVSDSKTIYYQVSAPNHTTKTGSYSLAITKATLKVTAANKSKTINAPDPVFTYSYSGNISGEVPSFSGSLARDSGETVGSYTIKIGTLGLQDNSPFIANNYSISFTSGTLTINPPAVVAGTPTITVSQNYLDGDYGTNAATISYSISGGTGTLSSITIKSNNVTLLNSTASSGNVHKYNLSTTLDYSVTYKDTYGNTDTKTGSVNVTYPYNKGFNYTYAYKNASGVNQTGTSKTFTNDGQKATQYCLTASEWNEMLKFLYSVVYRENGWSSTGLSAPTMVSSNSRFTKAIYNSALVLLNKLVSTSYSNVVSKERITAEHLNRFRNTINKNR